MKDSHYAFKKKKITLGEVKACAGLTIKEAAAKLGVTYNALYRVIQTYKLSHLFASGALIPAPSDKPRRIRRKPVLFNLGPELIEIKVPCYNSDCVGTAPIKYFPGDIPDKRRFCPQCKGRSDWRNDNAQLTATY